MEDALNMPREFNEAPGKDHNSQFTRQNGK